MSPLDLAGAVAPDYKHIAKHIQPGRPVSVAGALLKWYAIAPAEQPIPAEVTALAHEALEFAVSRLDGELGFVILHRCGASFYFLLISTWRNENELWETVLVKSGDHEESFGPWPLGAGHHPTFCVWELRAVCHEQAAWSRYLRSPRRANDMQTYLEDSYEGTTV